MMEKYDDPKIWRHQLYMEYRLKGCLYRAITDVCSEEVSQKILARYTELLKEIDSENP